MLGPFDHIDVRPTKVALATGDVVVFHTDGATDLPAPYDLDDTEWADLVNAAAEPGGTADDIADRIQDALQAILPFNSRNDDIALMVLAVRPRDDRGLPVR